MTRKGKVVKNKSSTKRGKSNFRNVISMICVFVSMKNRRKEEFGEPFLNPCQKFLGSWVETAIWI